MPSDMRVNPRTSRKSTVIGSTSPRWLTLSWPVMIRSTSPGEKKRWNWTRALASSWRRCSSIAFRTETAAWLAIEVNSSLARAIQPFHTPWDGDTLFAATTGEVANPELGALGVAMAASDLAWDAVLSAGQHAEAEPAAK